MKTETELREERGRTLDKIDDIIRTADERSDEDGGPGFTDEEREQLEAFRTEVAEIDEQLSAVRTSKGDEILRADFDAMRQTPAPMINLNRDPVKGDRNLDELLWATNEIGRTETGAAVGIEQVIVRSRPNDEGFAAPRLREFQPEHRDLVRTFQQTVADMSLVGMMVDDDANTSAKGFEVARSLPQFEGRWREICRAMDVDTSGEGADWVPTGIGAALHEQVRVSGKVAPLFARIPLPTNPWKMPVEGGDLTAYRVAEPTGDSETAVAASTAGTVAPTFDAEIFGARTLWSQSLDADSAIAIMPFTQRKLVQAFVDAEEKAILDGDADGTHQDSDTQAAGATHASSAWDGLRKRALANANVNTNATTTAANLAAVRKEMGKWGVNPADLAFIVGVTAMHDLLVDTALLTVDKFGPNATILNGQIGSLYGVPVIVSEHVREDLNASGVHDGITTNESYNLCVNVNEFAIGQRMAFDVKTSDELYMETFQRVAVAFMREDFQSIGSAAANDDVAIGRGIA